MVLSSRSLFEGLGNNVEIVSKLICLLNNLLSSFGYIRCSSISSWSTPGSFPCCEDTIDPRRTISKRLRKIAFDAYI